MNYFVKCKFPEVPTPYVGTAKPERKARFENRDRAFEFAAQALEDGATSVTIRPEA
jgi:hypothetical protein